MLSTLTDYNKTTLNPLKVWYTTQPIAGVPLSVAQQVTRYATKTYSYIGIDKDTSQQGAEDKSFQYMYPKRKYSWNGTSAVWAPDGMACAADVRTAKVEACLYAVDIDVNQTDSMVLSVNNRNIGQQNFYFEKSFNWLAIDYDEGDEPLEITNIRRDTTSLRTIIEYTQRVPVTFDYTHVLPFYRRWAYDDWTQEAVESFHDGFLRLGIEPWMAKWYRLMYYDYIDSNTGKYNKTWWSPQYYMPTSTGESQ